MKEDTIRTLPTQAELHALFDLDLDTGSLLWKTSGTGRRHGAGAPAGTIFRGRVRVGIRKVYYALSRLTWMYVKGEDPGRVMLDHKDGNPLNNRIENLRIASRETNLHNSKRRTDNTSGVKGVSFHIQHQKWQARVALNGTRYLLGYFDTLEEAAEAIRVARVEMHGEFANHG